MMGAILTVDHLPLAALLCHAQTGAAVAAQHPTPFLAWMVMIVFRSTTERFTTWRS